METNNWSLNTSNIQQARSNWMSSVLHKTFERKTTEHQSISCFLPKFFSFIQIYPFSGCYITSKFLLFCSYHQRIYIHTDSYFRHKPKTKEIFLLEVYQSISQINLSFPVVQTSQLEKFIHSCNIRWEIFVSINRLSLFALPTEDDLCWNRQLL